MSYAGVVRHNWGLREKLVARVRASRASTKRLVSVDIL